MKLFIPLMLVELTFLLITGYKAEMVVGLGSTKTATTYN